MGGIGACKTYVVYRVAIDDGNRLVVPFGGPYGRWTAVLHGVLRE